MNYLKVCSLVSDICDFLAILTLISNLIPLWSENIICVISILSNIIESCFRARNVIYLDKCFMSPWEECLFHCRWHHCSHLLYLYWLSVYLFYQLLTEVLETAINSGFIYFSFETCQFLLQAFEVLLLAAYRFKVIRSSWWIALFIIMKRSSFPCITVVLAFKSTVSSLVQQLPIWFG